MTTARDIATAALQKIGVLFAGETPSAADSALALSTLNELIDQWAAERLLIYVPNARTVWTIAASDGEYSVGSGGDVDIVRPVFVNQINYQDTSLDPTQEFPLNELTDAAWASLTPKDLTSSLPTSYYYDPTFGANGRATLYLWPIPTSSTLEGVMYAPTAITELATLDTTLSLPPGYRNFMTHALAEEIAPEFGRQVSASLSRAAAHTKGIVMRANVRMADLSMDAGALVQSRRWSGWSILTGP